MAKQRNDLAAAPAPLLDIDELSVAFPALRRGVDGGFARRQSFAERRRGARPRRRIRFGQDDDRARHHEAHSAAGTYQQGGDPLCGNRSCAPRRRGVTKDTRTRHRDDHFQSARRTRSRCRRSASRSATYYATIWRLGRRAIRERVLDLLRQVSIPDPERRVDAYPHELSGGMAQRVVIAIALACSPKFIISDDATSGLDVTVQAQVLELIRNLVIERGTSMLFITRDVAITAHYCDRIAILYAGEIMEVADRGVFFDDPSASLYGASASRLRPQRAAAALLAWRRQGPARQRAEPGRLLVPEPLRARAGTLPPRPSGAARTPAEPLRSMSLSSGAVRQ